MNKLPYWIKKKISITERYLFTKKIIERYHLNTVCTYARCPNIYECFERNYATFMILGNVCTRSCRFCSVTHTKVVHAPDPDEPEKIALAVKELNLKYVVITSVTRDDLEDCGAKHFASCIRAIKKINPGIRVEPLIPDMKGNFSHLDIILESMPDVLGHNIETVPALYPVIRPEAHYEISLSVIEYAKKKGFLTKSAIMVGMGETREQVFEVMKDLRKAGCDYFVIGQYLRPSPEHIEVKEFIHPEIFEQYRIVGESMGFKKVFSGVFCRSSYLAELAFCSDDKKT